MRQTANARLVERRQLATDICSFTFERADGRFTGLEAGAHVSVHLGDDLARSYSLTDWDEQGRWLRVAVKREPEGRGGSIAMHRLQVGQLLPISGPHNNFPVGATDRPVVLLGGGIGVTPLYAMARTLARLDHDFELHYYVRSRDLAAFDTAVGGLGLGDRYHLHCDDVDGLPDFWTMLHERPGNTFYYVCGPEVMLNAVQKASDELRRGTIVFERFSAAPSPHEGPETAFDIVLDSTGETLHVPADTTILQALRKAGHDIDYNCTEGTCGTCILDVLEGEIDHRDSILTEDEKLAGDCLCVCVSRAGGPRLVLDL